MALLIEIYRGNVKPRMVSVTQNGAAFPMTGYLLRFIVKADYGKADEEVIINKLVSFSTPATGIGILSLTHADTNQSPGNYICELKLYTEDGAYIDTLDVGIFVIKKVALIEI
jgi:hypothetical protein